MRKPVYIQMKKDGLACWHRVLVSPLKQPLLKRLQAGEPIDVHQLGQVLESGWGMPPEPLDLETILV